MLRTLHSPIRSFFFFNDTATTEIYTLSLHDALPISDRLAGSAGAAHRVRLPDRGGHPTGRRWGLGIRDLRRQRHPLQDRKSTRLNSSHQIISYAVFCLKKKKKKRNTNMDR